MYSDSTECVDGFYGDGCRNTCGHCTDMTQCHHVTGTCLEGCNPGYMGNDCMQGMDIRLSIKKFKFDKDRRFIPLYGR